MIIFWNIKVAVVAIRLIEVCNDNDDDVDGKLLLYCNTTTEKFDN